MNSARAVGVGATDLLQFSANVGSEPLSHHNGGAIGARDLRKRLAGRVSVWSQALEDQQGADRSIDAEGGPGALAHADAW
jgi:hypothetical protein